MPEKTRRLPIIDYIPVPGKKLIAAMAVTASFPLVPTASAREPNIQGNSSSPSAQTSESIARAMEIFGHPVSPIDVFAGGAVSIDTVNPGINPIETPDRVFSTPAGTPPAEDGYIPAPDVNETALSRIDAYNSPTRRRLMRMSLRRRNYPFTVAFVDSGISFSTGMKVVYGADFVNYDAKAIEIPGNKTGDLNGHGTHVSSLFDSYLRGMGLVSVRVTGQNGKGSYTRLVNGLKWIEANAAKYKIGLVNMSLGAPSTVEDCKPESKSPLHTVVRRLVNENIPIVVAAGNNAYNFSSQYIDNLKMNISIIPACFPDVLTAASVNDSDGKPGSEGSPGPGLLDIDDQAASYSNWTTDAKKIVTTIAAPGSWITGRFPNSPRTRAVESGTSMASPTTAGVVASIMLRPENRGKTPRELYAIIKQAARMRPPGTNFIGGRENPIQDPDMPGNPVKNYGDDLLYAGKL